MAKLPFKLLVNLYRSLFSATASQQGTKCALLKNGGSDC